MIRQKKTGATIALLLCMYFLVPSPLAAQKLKVDKEEASKQKDKKGVSRVLYGQASFYASKFDGRRTASGETFRHSKMTAACNSLPLGTWIRVTNLKNGKSVVVKTNDRLHAKTRRLIDLTKTAAQKLGFIKSGLTRVKVEVLKKKP